MGLLAVTALVVAGDPAKIARALAGADRRPLALMFPVVLLLYLFHGIPWWFALQGARANVVLRQAVSVTFISQAFDLVPGGDLWRVPIVRPEPL